MIQKLISNYREKGMAIKCTQFLTRSGTKYRKGRENFVREEKQRKLVPLAPILADTRNWDFREKEDEGTEKE